MAFTISEYPSDSMKTIFRIPGQSPDSDVRIKFHTYRSERTLSIIFGFSIQRCLYSGQPHTYSHEASLSDITFVNEHIGSSRVLDAQLKIIDDLYDKFRMALCVGNDKDMKDFFYSSAYKIFFLPLKGCNAPYKNEMKSLMISELYLDPEIESSLAIKRKAESLQGQIYKDTVEFQKKVSDHYKKYGTFTEKVTEYIKPFIPKI